MPERSRARSFRTTAITGWLFTAAACNYGVDVTDVPDDAVLKVMACASTIPPSQPCTILGSVKFETGDASGRNWKVDLTTGDGSFSDTGVTRTLRLTTDVNGEVHATFHAPADTGTVILTLAGGGVIATDTVRVVKPATPVIGAMRR